MKLFIVESPSKCGKLRKILGSDFKLMASVGHIRQIPKKGMNIDIKGGFIPTYEVTADRKKVVKEIKEAAAEADKIYLASDPDREGEAIAWSIYDELNAACRKKCVRVEFNEISKSAVDKAMSKERAVDMDKVQAQKARQVLDRLIGYKISPILWNEIGAGTSAGRVQSIALKIDCLREKEIKEFKPEDFWYIEALLKCKKGDFWAKVVTKDKDNRYFEEKIAADDFEKIKEAKFKIDKIEKGERKISANPPFDTASLASTCGSLFGWSVKKTATLSQGLYETGKVTYIRTDSYNISEDALVEVRGMIKKSFSKEYITDKPCVYHKKAKAVAQEAHECIRPVHVEEDGSDIDDDDAKKLYTLIRKRFIACQMAPMVVDTVTYMIKASSKQDLIAKGQNIKFDGWYKVYDYNTAKEEILPIAEDNEALDLKDIKKTKHSTSAPPRYNEASLVKKLEGEGVGRPSTYATIMESLFKRAYVQKVGKKNALEATELGLKVFDYLDPNFKDFFMDISFTASVEEDLDKIEHGEKGYLETVQNVYNVIEEGIKKTGSSGSAKKFGFGISTGATCECGKGNIVKKKGKFGDFFSCDLYPTCKNIYTKDGEGKFKLKEKKDSAPAEDTGEKCPKCKKGKIVKRKGSYGDFYACNQFPTCKTIFDKNGDDKFTIKEKWSKDSKDSKDSTYKKYPKKAEKEEDGEPSGDSEDDIV